MYQSNLTATLVININEKKLNSIYSSLAGNNDITYIIDTRGNIISHTDMDKIGTKCMIFAQININRPDGSFAYKNKESKEQVVYYSLKNTGWILVKEIPYKQFTSRITELKTISMISFLFSLVIISLFYSYWVNKITYPFKKNDPGHEGGRQGEYRANRIESAQK